MRAITERARCSNAHTGAHRGLTRCRRAETGILPWSLWWWSNAIRHGPQWPGEHDGADGGGPLPAMVGWSAGRLSGNLLVASGRVKENYKHPCDGGRNGERVGDGMGDPSPTSQHDLNRSSSGTTLPMFGMRERPTTTLRDAPTPAAGSPGTPTTPRSARAPRRILPRGSNSGRH